MAVTANQLIVGVADGDKVGYPVAASTHLYEGTLGFINSSGYLDDDTASGVNSFAGLVIEERDNSSGSNADVNQDVWREVEVTLTGSGFTQATVGQKIYAVDNFTITATGTTSGAVYIGVCTGYISTTQVRVLLDPYAQEASAFDSLSLNVLSLTGATGVNEFRLTDNLADALSIKITSGADMMVFKTTDSAESLTILSAATQKLGFFGTTAVVQTGAFTQTYATATHTHDNLTSATLLVGGMGGTANGTMETVGATNGSDVSGAILNNFQELFTQLNAMRVDLVNVKGVLNAAIDDQQLYGLFA